MRQGTHMWLSRNISSSMLILLTQSSYYVYTSSFSLNALCTLFSCMSRPGKGNREMMKLRKDVKGKESRRWLCLLADVTIRLLLKSVTGKLFNFGLTAHVSILVYFIKYILEPLPLFDGPFRDTFSKGHLERLKGHFISGSSLLLFTSDQFHHNEEWQSEI